MVDIFTNVSYAQSQLAFQSFTNIHMLPRKVYYDYFWRFDDAYSALLSTCYEITEIAVVQAHFAGLSSR
jgi:hypothetical protein